MDGQGSPHTSASQHALDDDLEDAICLLALFTDRHPDPEHYVSTVDFHASTRCEDEGDDWGEDEEALATIDNAQDEQLWYTKVLDRLAETLARFKTDRGKKKNLDAKHVAATLMVIDTQRQKVKIICAKNEGLDKKDETFLHEWKGCMEGISSKDEV
ncbi:hypothetical protein LTR85_000984 [Meristemomyces frigidus]|nr:hypothetical protein LTR85_000984 [Meristemomyces frigidus]